MTHEEMQRLLRQKPFVPFRVFVNDGRVYDVRHPQMTLLSPAWINIGVPAPGLAPPASDHAEQVRLINIERVEMLPPAMSLVKPAIGLQNALKATSAKTFGETGMTRDEIQQLLRQKPFIPFRVYVSDGRLYDVRHPRMNMLQQTYIKIGIPAPDLTPPICDHTEYVALKDITRIEMLPAEMSLVTP